MPYVFRWDFHVPKHTLPRLRFHHTYAMRARVVDVAGGGLSTSDPAAERCFTDLAVYQRYEPIAAPQLALPQAVNADALGAGGSLEQVVMREGAEPALTDTPALTRILLAPRTALTMVEQHGFFDNMTPQQIVDLVRPTIAAAGSGPAASDALFPDVTADGVCAFPRREPGAPTAARTDRAWGGQAEWPNLIPKEIVLRPRAKDDSVLKWDSDDRLIVHLKKAEQLTVELSSTVKDAYFADFAVKSGFSRDSQLSATAGRHPMITPPRALTFTYAIRRPLNDPTGTLTAQRIEGETFAVLAPALARLGVDVNSTAKLELSAAWAEPDGSGGRCKYFADVPVHAQVINRGDEALREIRQEFGDTRHRTIKYTATAVSRFRHFFPAGEDDSAFLARADLPPVVIPSSARPPQPIVVSTRPALKSEETREPTPAFSVVRRRFGGYLRVELGGSWYQTGQGEQLAVIVWPDNDPPQDMWPFLTQVGQDPTRESQLPDRFPTADVFDGAGTPRTLIHKDTCRTVVAVPYQPWSQDGRWFADIAMPSVASSTFWPFVQLALARYQPASLAGLELSPIVRTEMIQLMPSRMLRVRRGGDQVFDDIFVSLHGPVPPAGALFPSFEVFLERLQLPSDVPPGAVDLTALHPPDGLPAWVIAQGPLSGSLGPTEVHFAIPLAGSNHCRVRVQEISPITDADGFPTGDQRTNFIEVVELPVG